MKKNILQSKKQRMVFLLLGIVLIISASAFVAKSLFIQNTESVFLNGCIQVEFPSKMVMNSTSRIILKKDGEVFQPASVSWAVLGNNSGDVLMEGKRLSNKSLPLLTAVRKGKVEILVTIQDRNSENLCGRKLIRELVTLQVTDNSNIIRTTH